MTPEQICILPLAALHKLMFQILRWSLVLLRASLTIGQKKVRGGGAVKVWASQGSEAERVFASQG